jgi:succinate dehydrogenase / fumarate reductase cytochrome b subunit
MSVATLPTARARKFSKNALIAFYQSSIGKKYVVAVTALLLILYVLGHLAGNLQIYLGQDRINAYAKFLHDLGPILWVVRAILLAAFVIHIVATIQLAQENRLAKPQKYAVTGYQRSTMASRTMIVSGLIVLCFVIYHLLQFTLQTLGINNRKIANFVSTGGQTLAWVVFAGYISIPVTILLGFIR